MSKIRVDLYSPAGDRLGYGPIYNVTQVRIIRALDGAGNITLSFPGTDERATDLVSNEVRAYVYRVDDKIPGIAPVFLGSGVLRKVDVAATSSGWTLKASGPDMFDTLKRYNVLLRREWREVALETVLTDLVDLAGWVAVFENPLPQLVTVRLDGESVLGGLQKILTTYGLHFREDAAGSGYVEIGAFGVAQPLTLIQPQGLRPDAYRTADIAIVTRISVARDTASLLNWMVPIGGGEGLAALTLEHSTRVTPYTIQTATGPDGLPYWYLEDAASITAFGRAEKVLLFKDITPIDNTDAGIEIAANALYDAAVSHLQRYKQRLETYKLSVTKVDQTLRPGDKVRLVYRGLVYNHKNVPVDFLSINEELWILRITQSFARTGVTMDLEVATVDRYEEDTAKIVVGAIEAITLRNLKIQPYPTTLSYVYRREMDSTHNANVPIDISNGVLYLDRCRIRFTTRPFRTTVTGASSAGATIGTTSSSPATVASTTSGGSSAPTSSSGGSSSPTSSGGGDHNHRMLQHSAFQGMPSFWRRMFGRNSSGGATLDVVIGMNTNVITDDLWTESSSGNHTHTVTIAAHTHTVTIAAHTHDVTLPAHTHDITLPGHTHTLSYGIIDDATYPDTIRCYVNGIDRTVALGGPWQVGGGAADEVIEISAYLNGAGGGLRQLHDVEFRCDAGRGEVETTVELKITVQSIQQV